MGWARFGRRSWLTYTRPPRVAAATDRRPLGMNKVSYGKAFCPPPIGGAAAECGRWACRYENRAFDDRPGLAGRGWASLAGPLLWDAIRHMQKGLKMSVRSSVVPGCLVLAILVAAASQSHADWTGICSCKS